MRIKEANCEALMETLRMPKNSLGVDPLHLISIIGGTKNTPMLFVTCNQRKAPASDALS